eukprot:scaffold281683_cov32-Tisochrysis_lutea.AAC.3
MGEPPASRVGAREIYHVDRYLARLIRVDEQYRCADEGVHHERVARVEHGADLAELGGEGAQDGRAALHVLEDCFRDVRLCCERAQLGDVEAGRIDTVSEAHGIDAEA